MASAWDSPFIRSAQATTTEGKHRFRYESSPAPSPSRQPSKSPPQKKEPVINNKDSISSSFVAPDDFYPAPSEYQHQHQHNPAKELSAWTIDGAPKNYQQAQSTASEPSTFESSVSEHNSFRRQDQEETPGGNVGHVSSQEFIIANRNNNNTSDAVDEEVAMQDYLAWLESQHGSYVA